MTTWAAPTMPFMQYDGTNAESVRSWLEDLESWWNYTNDLDRGNPTVTITDESDGVLQLLAHSSSTESGGYNQPITLNTDDWVNAGLVAVPAAAFAEQYIVKA